MSDGTITVAVHTLGCKVNQWDTDSLVARLVEAGYKICKFNQVADIYIINTCTVTHTGDKKSLQMIRRGRKLNPSAFIAICGCMPRNRVGPENEITTKITAAGADFVFDARKPETLLARLKSDFLPPSGFAPNKQDILKERTRAFIKIQDGCDRYCAYCIVPYVRGQVVSRPPSDILAEARAHIEDDIKEIVLTGIQVAAYGYDTGSAYVTLPKLIGEVAELSEPSGFCRMRLRLSSIDPWAVDDEFLSVIAGSPTLCSHFHLSLQSGSDNTLARMNRRYTTADYARVAKKIRAIRPNTALTTDVIVGFPGETDQDFSESLAFVNKIGFSKIHVFEYSQRAGTKAADMPNQVPGHIKSARGEEMRALAKNLHQSFLLSQIGTVTTALFETRNKESPETWQGYTDNYCLVRLVHMEDSSLANTFQKVKITGITDDGLIGMRLSNI